MVTKQSAVWDVYKTSRNRVNIALRHAKAEYYRTKIAHQKIILSWCQWVFVKLLNGLSN